VPDNFASQFELIADLAPGGLAVAAGDRELTWAEFDERADRLAGHLAASGIGPGDRVGIAARNSPEYLVALNALFKLGATMVNINYRYRAGEIRHLLESARVRGVLADADLADEVRAAGCPLVVVLTPAPVDAERLPRTERGDAEWLLFTGGTTGYPKAVLGSHTERLRALRATGFDAFGLPPSDDSLPLALGRSGEVVALPASPLMHGTGLYAALTALSCGAPVALLPGRTTTGPDLVTAIERHGVTDLTIVGDAFALRLLDALDTPSRIPSLRRIRSVGAVLSPDVKRRLLAHADLTLHDNIAASEGGMYAMSTVTRSTLDHLGTFTPAPGARLLALDEDEDLPPTSTDVGRLAAPVVAGAGYLGDQAATDAAFRDIDGVRYSVPGDLARWTPDGRLVLLGRGSSVINTGGEKVYAEEVETVLRSHPAVRDAVVVGVPDPTWGRAVGAVVALSADARASAEELAAFVGERLAGYKKPRHLAFVPEVRRLNTGKNDLAWAAAQLSSS
jgi:3-oxocholest-4-en-26-oate---CoA ligase